MPSFGMYTAEGRLVSWLQPSGSPVQKGKPVLEIETEKATQEVFAPATGRLHHVAEIGTQLKVEDLIGYVLEDGELLPGESGAATPSTPALKSPSTTVSSVPTQPPHSLALGARIVATPVARRLASQNGIDLAQLAGSGPGGRIVEADVQSAMAGHPGTKGSNSAISATSWNVAERIPISTMRRIVGERLRHSLNTAVSLTLTREVEADRLVAARRRLSEQAGISIPFDAFFARFLAEALRERPELNVVIEGDTALRLQDVDIGIAVDIPGGLIVPVVRNPVGLSLVDMAKSIRMLVERARVGKISTAELEGASSTISNLGRFGVDVFTPVLNPPQSTILGIGRIHPQPVARNGAVVAADVCVLSLTFDHRVADGVPAAQLLDGIARRMNDEANLAQLL
jgi:pyruvate dehydrogenase E2 component (dihydrolipoamide acetyltransferase)